VVRGFAFQIYAIAKLLNYQFLSDSCLFAKFAAKFLIPLHYQRPSASICVICGGSALADC
jgi:hypothetical protein